MTSGSPPLRWRIRGTVSRFIGCGVGLARLVEKGRVGFLGNVDMGDLTRKYERDIGGFFHRKRQVPDRDAALARSASGQTGRGESAGVFRRNGKHHIPDQAFYAEVLLPVLQNRASLDLGVCIAFDHIPKLILPRQRLYPPHPTADLAPVWISVDYHRKSISRHWCPTTKTNLVAQTSAKAINFFVGIFGFE